MIMNFQKTKKFEEIYTLIYNRDGCVAFLTLTGALEEDNALTKKSCYNTLVNGLIQRVKKI